MQYEPTFKPLIQFCGAGGQERNHFIGKQNHVARLSFLTNRLPFCLVPSLFFPLAPGHNTALCSILPYESSSSTQLSWCTRPVITMTAVCSMQYMLSEVKDCMQASNISITMWKVKGRKEAGKHTLPPINKQLYLRC